MENVNPNGLMPDNSISDKQKKPYQTPKMQRFGGLTELVQFNSNTGADGETIWIDCTSL